ncbi:hypothetical protein MAR_006028 [Mya arenaria]|uniref:Uncharacterized protein n=1 Tax=Mya arenaria TaxID=6604 RepID=A0ABY7D9S6_MYAAR|nr:hypothetical protein MAR_006028 [Mya arenaria]
MENFGLFSLDDSLELDFLDSDDESFNTIDIGQFMINTMLNVTPVTTTVTPPAASLSQGQSLNERAADLGPTALKATPKQTEARKQAVLQFSEYHRNTLTNIRSALNRHLKDLKRDIDLVRDKAFTSANNTLNGFLKHRTSNEADLEKIRKYLELYETSAIVLRECVWYLIAIHFVTRGLEVHHQLRNDSLVVSTDDSVRERQNSP